MRRLRILVFIGVLVLGVASFSSGDEVSAETTKTQVQQERYFRIVVAVANVRSEPSTLSPVVTKVERGTVVKVLGLGGDWVKVSVLAEGVPEKVGYIWRTLGALESFTIEASVSESPAPPVVPTSQTTLIEPKPKLVIPTFPNRPANTTGKLPGFTEWSVQLERARAERGKGIRFMLIGGATVVVAPLIGGAISSAGDGTPGTVLTLMATLGGTGILGYGGFTLYKAREEIEDLDQDGRIKGYLTLGPVPGGGAQVALNIRF